MGILGWLRRRSPPASGDGGDVVDQIKDLAHDLMALEINTIIKDSMTAQRIPGPPGALLEIAEDYAKFMGRLGIDLDPYFETEATDDLLGRVPLRLLAGGAAACGLSGRPIVFGRTFRRLRWAARLARHGLPLLDRDRLLLERIENNCDSLHLILEKYPPLLCETLDPADIRSGSVGKLRGVVLDARHLLAIRKMWEIGTEEIVAQTVIQLDGDVVTRITPALAALGDQGMPILAIHQNGIQTGITSWRHLTQTVQSVLRAMVDPHPSGR